MSLFNPQSQRAPMETAVPRVEVRPLLRLVYMWMGFGLLVTTLMAVFTYNYQPLRELILSPGVLLVAVIAELGLVIGLAAAMRKLSPGVAATMFFVYSGLNGFTLSIIFMVYDLGSIASAFSTTVILFGVMTAVGFTTEVDLTRYRTYFMMGLIGLVIAMVVNMFIGSGGLDLLISIGGVILFTALTAYDTQKIKRLAADPNVSATGDLTMKLSILGALTLYLDFINLFLFLLRLLGGRR